MHPKAAALYGCCRCLLTTFEATFTERSLNQGCPYTFGGSRAAAGTQNGFTLSSLTDMPWPVRPLVNFVPSEVATIVQPCAL